MLTIVQYQNAIVFTINQGYSQLGCREHSSDIRNHSIFTDSTNKKVCLEDGLACGWCGCTTAFLDEHILNHSINHITNRTNNHIISHTGTRILNPSIIAVWLSSSSPSLVSTTPSHRWKPPFPAASSVGSLMSNQAHAVT